MTETRINHKIRKDITISKHIIAEAKVYEKNFSQFLTTAADFYLDHLKKIKFEQEMKDGYEANADLFSEVNDDFRHSDAEIAPSS